MDVDSPQNTPLLHIDIDTEVCGSDILVPSPQRSKPYLLGMYSLLLLVASVGNSIYFKKMQDHMPNYPYMLSQSSTIVYIPIFSVLVGYSMLFTKSITPDMRKVPWYKFFIMGALDSIAGLLILLGGGKTSGSIQPLLLQAVIPVTMALAYFILKERYRNQQYLGAFVILVGVASVLIPSFFTSTPKSSEASNNSVFFNLLFLLSNLPSGLSSVVKEIVFVDDMDVNYLQLMVAIWQFTFGFFLAPFNSFKFLGDSYVPFNGLPSALYNGTQCLVFGINTIVTECGEPDLRPCDDCFGAYIPFVIYLGFNIMYNCATILVIKYGGANLMYFVMTLRLPLVQLAFAVSLIYDPPEPFKWYYLTGLVIILSGLLTYRYGTPSTAPDGTAEIGLLPIGGMEVSSRLMHMRATDHMVKRMNPQAVRSQYFGRLGITGSPRSRQFRDSFRGGSPTSSGWGDRI